MRKLVTVAVSGGFDPLHIGHLHHIKVAKSLGHVLIVILNSDRFLMAKKTYVFMPRSERKELLESLKYVDWVQDSIDEDQTVARTLELVRPDIFAKGGDRVSNNMPQAELDVCQKLGIEIVYGAGGDTIHSSRRIVEAVKA